jgi:hypothetical protein
MLPAPDIFWVLPVFHCSAEASLILLLALRADCFIRIFARR